jgi:hypothetical protein
MCVRPAKPGRARRGERITAPGGTCRPDPGPTRHSTTTEQPASSPAWSPPPVATSDTTGARAAPAPRRPPPPRQPGALSSAARQPGHAARTRIAVTTTNSPTHGHTITQTTNGAPAPATSQNDGSAGRAPEGPADPHGTDACMSCGGPRPSAAGGTAHTSRRSELAPGDAWSSTPATTDKPDKD